MARYAAFACTLLQNSANLSASRNVAGLASGGAGSDQPLALTSGPLDDTNPVWSPDGSRIAFLRRPNAEFFQAIVIPARGGSERVIANIPGRNFQPQVVNQENPPRCNC